MGNLIALKFLGCDYDENNKIKEWRWKEKQIESGVVWWWNIIGWSWHGVTYIKPKKKKQLNKMKTEITKP